MHAVFLLYCVRQYLHPSITKFFESLKEKYYIVYNNIYNWNLHNLESSMFPGGRWALVFVLTALQE